MDTATTDRSNNNNSSDQDSFVCWICHDKAGVLLTNFCRCSGSLGHVHQSCLQTFVDSTEGGTEKEHCPTCKRKYKFNYYSKDGKEPPAQPQSLEAHAWFFLSKFLLPVSLEYGLAILELVVNWIAPGILIGSAVFLGRAIAIDFWTSHAEGIAGMEMRKPESRYYDYAANYMDQSVFDAMLVGLVLLGLRKRINSGKAQILSATTPNIGAPVAPMEEQPPQAQEGGDEHQQEHQNDINNNNNNMIFQEQNLRNLADLNAFVREDDEEETDGDDDDEEEEEEQGQAQEGNDQQEHLPGQFDEAELMNAMNVIANAEEGVPNQNENGAAAVAENNENINNNNNNNNNNRRGRNRRNRRKGGNTFDQLLWKGVEMLQSAARYPHSDPLTAYDAILLVDTPFMIATLLFFGLSPVGFCLYHIAWVIYNRVTKNPPKLRDLRNRFEEAGRRLKNESTEDDRDRYYHIYCYDATFLYLMLSLVCGIVAHESLGRTNFTQNEHLKNEVLTQYLLHNNASHNVDVEFNGTLNDLYVDSLLNPWTIFTQGILPRFFNVLHHPWNALFHWVFGYLLAGAITAVESQLITPVFAPGCNLVYFRSIHLSDELATFRYMLIQLYDVNIIDGISHCFKLFATYAPFVFFSGWLVSNSLRFSIILGYVLYEHIEDHAHDIVNVAMAIVDGSINDMFHNSAAAASNGGGMTGLLRDVLDHAVRRSIEIFAACPSAAIGDWSVLWPGSALPGSFWLSFALVATGASAFYFLPYQYLVLRRFLPLAKALARAMSLEDFLFEPSQMANVDHFMEVSASLPVRSDNVMELPMVHVPVHQTAVRRERFVDPSKIPRFHLIRVFVFVHILLAKAFADWVIEVCIQRVLVFSVVSAAIRGAFATFSFNFWSLVPGFTWSTVLRICFDPMILWWRTCTSVTGLPWFATWADLLSQVADFLFGASPFLPLLFPTNNTNNEDASFVTTMNDNNPESSSAAAALVVESVINLVNQSAQDISPFQEQQQQQQPPFMLVGFWLVGFSFMVALIKYPSELSMAAGYVLVTPLAIVFGVAEFFKPAWDNWAGTFESIWRSAYGVKRVITPNNTNDEEEQDEKSNKDKQEDGGKKKNNMIQTDVEVGDFEDVMKHMREWKQKQQQQEQQQQRATTTAATPGGVSNDEQFIKFLEHMTRRLSKNNNNSEGLESLQHRQERERQLLQDLEDNGMFDPTLEQEKTAQNNATAIRQWLDIQQNNNNNNTTSDAAPHDALTQLLFMQQQQQQQQQHHHHDDDDDDDENDYRVDSDRDEVAQ